MRFLRPADIAEVIAACPPDPATVAEAHNHQPYGVWSLTVHEIGGVGVQHPDGEPGTIASIRDRWMEWLSGSDPNAEHSRVMYELFRAAIRAGGALVFRPILFGVNRQIHDGRHRLFAAYDCRDERPELVVQVFWNSLPVT